MKFGIAISALSIAEQAFTHCDIQLLVTINDFSGGGGFF